MIKLVIKTATGGSAPGAAAPTSGPTLSATSSRYSGKTRRPAVRRSLVVTLRTPAYAAEAEDLQGETLPIIFA